MRTKLIGVIYGVAVAVLAVAAFGIGLRCQPDSHAGRNLYDPQGKRDWAQSASNGLMLTALHTPSKRVADGAGAPGSDAGGADNSLDDSPAATFQQVYLLVERDFVDPLPKDTVLGHDAVRAMLASLQDPESRFLEPAELADLRQRAKGVYHGIGAVTSIRKRIHPKGATRDLPGYTEYQLTVVTALPGGPAEKAGLKPGDIVTGIDHQWVAGYDPIASEAAALKAAQQDPVTVKNIFAAIQKKIDNSLSIPQAASRLDGFDQKKVDTAPSTPPVDPELIGPETTPIVLTISRPGETKPIEVSVERSTVTVPPAVSRPLPGGLGYIKVTQFTDGSDAEIGKALDALGGDIKGLVLDLRNDPGGALESGAAVAAHMTSAPALGYLRVKGKSNTVKKDTIIAIKHGSVLTCPVVVLVNGGTAGTAELLASTLEARGSKVVGTPTFGDASDVQVIPLRDGAAFTMTIGEILRANRQSFAGAGIKPDVLIQDVSGNDQPLTAAIGLLTNRVASRPAVRG